MMPMLNPPRTWAPLMVSIRPPTPAMATRSTRAPHAGRPRSAVGAAPTGSERPALSERAGRARVAVALERVVPDQASAGGAGGIDAGGPGRGADVGWP